MKRFTRGTRLLVALAIAVAVIAGGATSAGAKSGPSQVTVPLNFSFGCGLSTKKGNGTATFIREKGLLTIRVRLHGAFPGKYKIILGKVSTPGICTALSGFVRAFGVDASGEGEATVSGFVPVFQSFLIAVVNFDNGAVYQSDFVKLGSN